MSKISETFNFGNPKEMDIEELVLYLEQMYSDLAQAINKKPNVYDRETLGDPTDRFLSNGDINIFNNGVDPIVVEMVVDHPTQTTVTWKVI